MTSKELAKEYVNLLAQALSILCEYKGNISGIYSLVDFEKIKDKYYDDAEEFWSKRQDKADVLRHLKQMILSARKDIEQTRFIIAYAICIWMDSHITYRLDRDEPEKISLWSFIDCSDVGYIKIGALNDNYATTKVWINPRFPIRKAYDLSIDDKNRKERRLSNRDAFEGINGILKNFCYYSFDGSCEVVNVVISDEFKRESEENTLKISFAPLSCNKVDFEITNVTINRDGYEKSAIEVEFNDADSKIHDRMIRDWKLACKNGTSIMFMPEMLGTSRLDCTNPDNLDWISELCIDELVVGEKPPKITIWPSYWHERKNGATITGDDGTVIGVQYKNFPYIDRNDHLEEAIEECGVKRYYVIHIPGVHRVAVVICSEFISEKKVGWSKVLCGCLGVSLLIVPSYSSGELDFINSTMRYVDYDTTVVWGNCCGAAKGGCRCIGAVSKPGSNTMEIFGDDKKCSGTCTDGQSCIFIISIPLDVTVYKKVTVSQMVEHITA